MTFFTSARGPARCAPAAHVRHDLLLVRLADAAEEDQEESPQDLGRAEAAVAVLRLDATAEPPRHAEVAPGQAEVEPVLEEEGGELGRMIQVRCVPREPFVLVVGPDEARLEEDEV